MPGIQILALVLDSLCQKILISSRNGSINEIYIVFFVYMYSGTTAVVALLHDKDLYVANAGDSRCVICRKDGTTEDMSFDHKVPSSNLFSLWI